MSQSLASSSKNKSHVQAQEEEEDDLVILPDVDNSELIARYQLSLVGRLFNRERRSVEALISLLPRPSIWDVEGRVRGVDLGNHRFQFDFDSEEDLQKVLSKRPCHYNKWSFAPERWVPHIGDSFPNTMTFWVTVMGIPTHFWLEPIFRALGSRLGHVGPVEAKTAKFQVELNAELPLKFALRAQLPSGEIVPVSLEYVNLHRWCHSCHLISHEDESCPSLTEEERKQHRLAKEANRELGQQPRIESNRNSDLAKRLGAAAPKGPRYNERRDGEGTQRDNRNSVWKRIDSRYAPRDDYREQNRHNPREEKREDNRHAGRGRDALPPTNETYNKRRYDDSFAASRHREEAKRGERKHVPSSHSSKGETAMEDPRDKLLACPTHSSKGEKGPEDPLKAASEQPQMAKQINSSPDHVRERPFRLNIQKKSSGDLKLKGKVGDLDDSSESVSSAQKSLKLADENKRSPSQSLLPATKEEIKKKSWYELTVEEEEEAVQQDTKASEMINEVQDPNAEKILEEEDWMIDGDNFYDDDLMEEDELLYAENQTGDESALALVPANTPQAGKEPIKLKDKIVEEKVVETQNRLPGNSSEPVSNQDHSSSNPSLQSPHKKKKGSPNPNAAGLSLRKRNLILGRASPKLKQAKDGPTMGPKSSIGRLDKPIGGGNDETLTKTNNKSTKVGNKPPKIPK